MLRLKNKIEDFENRRIFRRLAEGDRGEGAIAQIISYLDALLDIFQASSFTPIMMGAR